VVRAGRSNIQSTAVGKKTYSSFGSILLQVRTHFARPNWKEVFNKIASKHPFGTVGKDSIQINKTPFHVLTRLRLKIQGIDLLQSFGNRQVLVIFY